MKSSHQTQSIFRGMTLLEMTIVILVLLSLISVGMYSSKGINDWKLAREASENLRSVYTAQRMYLADNPTALVSSITESQIIDYLPNMPVPKPASLKLALPPLKSLTGGSLGFRVTVSPPILIDSANAPYDPSGSTTDSLWDVGK